MALKLVLQNVKDYGMYLKCSFKYFQTRQTHCIKRMDDWLSAWWLSHPFSHFPYSTHLLGNQTVLPFRPLTENEWLDQWRWV